MNRIQRISECAGLWSRWMSKKEIEDTELNISKRRELSRKANAESGWHVRSIWYG